MSENSILQSKYFLQKKALLTQCLHFSEELASSLEEWESIQDIIAGRETVIGQIKELEEKTDKAVQQALTAEQKSELDQTVKLILDLDKNTVSLMRLEQQNIMASLKTNMQGQKLMHYTQTAQPANGRIMNYKK
jgi:hypothetical protein